MKTINEMIEHLTNLRASVGGDCKIFVDGWNDSGIVGSGEPLIIRVAKTGFLSDGEVIRVWEESTDGEIAALIGPYGVVV